MKYYYLLDRVYKKSDNYVKNGGNDWRYYGWTNHKSILKLFFQQRDPKKYDVFRYNEYEIEDNKNLIDFIDEKYEIQPIKLASVKADGRKIILYTTEREEREAEESIKRTFSDLASLTKHNDLNDEEKLPRMVKAYCGFKEKYLDALDAIGFFPEEIENKFDSVDDPYYESSDDCNFIFPHRKNDIGSKPYHQVLYSLESFIKVMKEDM